MEYKNNFKLNEAVNKDSQYIEDIKERTIKLVNYFIKKFDS